MANCLKSRIYIRLEPPDWEALWYLGCDPEVIRLGFEPKTHSLEGCCSIQLSYRTIICIGYIEKAMSLHYMGSSG